MFCVVADKVDGMLHALPKENASSNHPRPCQISDILICSFGVHLKHI